MSRRVLLVHRLLVVLPVALALASLALLVAAGVAAATYAPEPFRWS
jgi:hypothetical protein